MTVIEQIKESTMKGAVKKVQELVRAALEEKMNAADIISQGFIPAMEIVGDKFKKGEIFVPEMLVAARAMQGGIKIIEPLFAPGERQYIGKCIIGTVRSDLHDIGKNLVAMILQGAGFEVIDIGIDVPAEKFVSAIQEHKPQIVGLCALLTTTLPEMGTAIQAIKTAGIREQVKIVVGGAPVTQSFADSIGADAYASDAGAAVEICKALLN
ncbi:B12-binding domain-containing protein [Sporomusa aerivorans]|uniref:cobalamin B12-binding domain-containing protein n=1 Tax=Sporomusa aerivorans TaxID=204936 RepID=UPI00352B92F2